MIIISILKYTMSEFICGIAEIIQQKLKTIYFLKVSYLNKFYFIFSLFLVASEM